MSFAANCASPRMAASVCRPVPTMKPILPVLAKSSGDWIETLENLIVLKIEMVELKKYSHHQYNFESTGIRRSDIIIV